MDPFGCGLHIRQNQTAVHMVTLSKITRDFQPIQKHWRKNPNLSLKHMYQNMLKVELRSFISISLLTLCSFCGDKKVEKFLNNFISSLRFYFSNLWNHVNCRNNCVFLSPGDIYGKPRSPTRCLALCGYWLKKQYWHRRT